MQSFKALIVLRRKPSRRCMDRFTEDKDKTEECVCVVVAEEKEDATTTAAAAAASAASAASVVAT